MPTRPRVGKVSAFVGSRLLTLGFVAGLVGSAFFIFTGIELWLAVTRGRFGPNLIPMVAGGCLAFALLSIGGSATRAGHRYMVGKRSVANDFGRFLGRRIERRRRARGR